MSEQNEQQTIFNEVETLTGEDKKHIGNAKIALYIVCGIQVLSAVIASFQLPAYLIVDIWIEVIVVSGIFLVLSMLAEKYAYQSLLAGLIMYLLYQGIYAFVDPSTILNGLLFKIGIIIYLSRGVIYAYDFYKLKQTNRK